MNTMYVRSGLTDTHGQPTHGYKVEFAHSGEDDCYVGQAPDLPGCIFHGANEVELALNAGDAIREWIDEARRLGHVVPGEVKPVEPHAFTVSRGEVMSGTIAPIQPKDDSALIDRVARALMANDPKYRNARWEEASPDLQRAFRDSACVAIAVMRGETQ